MLEVGLNCRIIKNVDGSIHTVEAPNGEPSILYKEALRVTGSEDKASDIWAIAYTKGYADYIGMKVQDIASDANVDQNGEPLFEDVSNYILAKESVSGDYTRGEMVDVNDFIASTGFRSVDNIYDRLSMLFDDGSIIFTKARLTSSGIWSEAEAERIMGNPVIAARAKISIRRFMDYYSSYEESQDYYMVDEASDVLVHTEEYTSFGTRKILEPFIVSNRMKEELSGITDRSEFDRAVNSLPYGEVVERYNEDADYAESVYNKYSTLSKIPVVDTEGNSINQIESGFRMFFRMPKRSDFIKADETMNDLLMMDQTEWDSDATIPKLKHLESYAAGMELDIVGLSDMHDSKTREEIVPFISDLMIFSRMVQSEGFSSERDISVMLSSRESLFGKPAEDYKIEELSENLRDLNLVYFSSSMDSKSAFEDFGLLSVNGYPGVYQKVDNSVSKEDIYEFLYEAETDRDLRAKIIPDSAMKSIMGKDGVDFYKLRDPKNKEVVIMDIASYVRGRMLPGDTEQMAAYRVAFGHPENARDNIQDINRYLDRYMESERKVVTYSLAQDIYHKLLKLKVKNAERYNDIFSGIKYIPGKGFCLLHSDMHTLRGIDLAMEDDLRDSFKKYALSSIEPSLFDMFYIKRHSMGEANEGFYMQYYMDNPAALKESKGSSEQVSDKIMSISGEFSNFVRTGSNVYEKISEHDSGSYYAEIGTDMTGVMEKIGSISERNAGQEVGNSVSFIDSVSRNSEISRRLEC